MLLPVATPAAFRLFALGWTQRSFQLLYLSECAISSDPLSPRIRAPCHSCHECRSVFVGRTVGHPKGVRNGLWVLGCSFSLFLSPLMGACVRVWRCWICHVIADLLTHTPYYTEFRLRSLLLCSKRIGPGHEASALGGEQGKVFFPPRGSCEDEGRHGARGPRGAFWGGPGTLPGPVAPRGPRLW